MDVSKWIPKEKLDDLVWLTLGMGSFGYLLTKSAIMTVIIMALFVTGFILVLYKEQVMAWYKGQKEEQTLVPPTEEKPTPVKKDVAKKEKGKGRIELGKFVTISEDGKRQFSDIPVKIDLEDLGHTFIMGMTGYGKTTFLYWLIAEIIKKYDSSEVLMAFSDAKGVSFNIYSKSKHIFAPIATNKEETTALIALAHSEMERRRDLFKQYADTRLCTNIQQYEKITGEKLPYILFIFDELADAVDKDSDAEKQLISLAKMSRSTGIRLIMATQRPTATGISHEVQTQCQTIVCGYMKSSREYGNIAQIPQTVYRHMTALPGLSIVFTPKLAPEFLATNSDCEGWGLLMGNYLNDEAIEKIADEDRDITKIVTSLSVENEKTLIWEGSEDNKFELIARLESKLGRDVEIADMCAAFNIHSVTARAWRNKYYG